jgi:DNA primase
LPLLQPGKSLRFAMLQGGEDPDSLLRKEGAAAVEAVLMGAIPLDRMVWDIETEAVRLDTPERIAGVKKGLEERARSIVDRTVQEQYLAALRQRLNDTVWGARRAAFRGNRPPPKPQPAGEGARRGVRPLDRRREQLLLLALINHPDLLDEFGEAIGMIELSDRGLERLRGEVLRVWQQNSALDSSLLRLHLRETGVAETLALLDGPEVRFHAEFARAGAPREGARRGLMGLLAPFRQRDWRAQLDEAQRAWREDQTEANWARMQGLIEASQRAEAEIAAVDDEIASLGVSPPRR